MSTTLQRSEVPIIREAIRRYVRDGSPFEVDYPVGGHVVLISREPVQPKGRFNVGLYRPGVSPDGECDGYYVCTVDGETCEGE